MILDFSSRLCTLCMCSPKLPVLSLSNIRFLDWGLTVHDLELPILGNLGLRTRPQAGKKGQVPTRVLVQPQGKPGLLVSSQVSLRTRSSSSQGA